MLWLDDHRGVYIPRDFANCFTDRAKFVQGVTDEQWAILEQGPDAEFYWDVWTEVLDNATVTDGKTVCRLYQDGALWLIPEGMEWSDENEFFVWPDEQDDAA
jgi:hypothetical protein